MSENNTSLCGVYGLRIDAGSLDGGIDPDRLVAAGADWPRWEICWEPLGRDAAEGAAVVEEWSPTQAVLTGHPSGRVVIDRSTSRTTLHLAEPPSAAAIAHPYLASTGVVANHWLGRTPFHAGAFEFDGRAWGVLGGREMGKSSVLMWLHRSGIPILADDVLVLDGTSAYSGPRCIDLRRSAAEHFEQGEYLGVVGTRERWRVGLPAAPGVLPFGGWVLLGWSDAVDVEPPPAHVRLEALATHRGLTASWAPAHGLLELVDFPMVVFARPHRWDTVDRAMARLLDELGALSGATAYPVAAPRATPA